MARCSVSRIGCLDVLMKKTFVFTVQKQLQELNRRGRGHMILVSQMIFIFEPRAYGDTDDLCPANFDCPLKLAFMCLLIVDIAAEWKGPTDGQSHPGDEHALTSQPPSPNPNPRAMNSCSDRDLDLDTGLDVDDDLLDDLSRRIQIDQPLVDAHLKHVPRLGAFTARRLPRRHFQRLGRQADGALDAKVLGFGALEELRAHFFQ